MILNHSKTIRSVISLLCISIMVSWSTVGILHFLLFYYDLISCTTPACFSTFYRYAMVPTIPICLKYLFFKLFL